MGQVCPSILTASSSLEDRDRLEPLDSAHEVRRRSTLPCELPPKRRHRSGGVIRPSPPDLVAARLPRPRRCLFITDKERLTLLPVLQRSFADSSRSSSPNKTPTCSGMAPNGSAQISSPRSETRSSI